MYVGDEYAEIHFNPSITHQCQSGPASGIEAHRCTHTTIYRPALSERVYSEPRYNLLRLATVHYDPLFVKDMQESKR